MMTFPKPRRFFDLHSISGIFLGLTMYVVCFSGILAVLSEYFSAWERPELRSAETVTKLCPQAALDTLRRESPAIWESLPISSPAEPEGNHAEVFFFAPTPAVPFTHIRWFDQDAGRSYDYFVDPQSGRVVEEPVFALESVLVNLHTDLLLPRPWGRYLVGVLGVGFLFVILSGLFFHRKMLKQMFIFRRGKSRRILWGDSHKLFGAWGLLFHLMITFTGAFLGLIGIFLTVSALTVYRGDQEAALMAVVPHDPPPAGEQAVMLPMDELMKRASGAWPELQPDMVILHAWGDREATFTVGGTVPGLLSYSGVTGTQITLSAVDGSVTRRTNWPQGSLWQRLVSWIIPLHYATFGGILLKIAYCLLGLSSALLSVTGLMIWLERRPSPFVRAHFKRLEKIVIGTCLGLPAATAVLFATVRCLPGNLDNPVQALEIVFLACWLLSLLFALSAPGRRESALGLTTITGSLLLLAPLLNGILTSDGALNAWITGSPTVAGVDFTLLALGFLVLLGGRAYLSRSPGARPFNPDIPAGSIELSKH